jgi:hypothetical protein
MPDSLQTMLHKGIRDSINEFDLDAARSSLKIALKHKPTAETYYLVSMVAETAKEKKKYLEKALELDPFNEEAFAEMEVVQAREVEMERAEQMKKNSDNWFDRFYNKNYPWMVGVAVSSAVYLAAPVLGWAIVPATFVAFGLGLTVGLIDKKMNDVGNKTFLTTPAISAATTITTVALVATAVSSTAVNNNNYDNYSDGQDAVVELYSESNSTNNNQESSEKQQGSSIRPSNSFSGRYCLAGCYEFYDDGTYVVWWWDDCNYSRGECEENDWEVVEKGTYQIIDNGIGIMIYEEHPDNGDTRHFDILDNSTIYAADHRTTWTLMTSFP